MESNMKSIDEHAFNKEHEKEIKYLIEQYEGYSGGNPGITFLFHCHQAIRNKLKEASTLEPEEAEEFLTQLTIEIKLIISHRYKNLYLRIKSKPSYSGDIPAFRQFESRNFIELKFDLYDSTIRELKDQKVLPNTFEECRNIVHQVNEYQIKCLRNIQTVNMRIVPTIDYLSEHGMVIHSNEFFAQLENVQPLPFTTNFGNGSINEYIDAHFTRIVSDKCTVTSYEIIPIHRNCKPPQDKDSNNGTLTIENLTQITICERDHRKTSDISKRFNLLDIVSDEAFENWTQTIGRKEYQTFDISKIPIQSIHSKEHEGLETHQTVQFINTSTGCKLTKKTTNTSCKIPITPLEYKNEGTTMLTQWYGILATIEKTLAMYEVAISTRTGNELVRYMIKLTAYLRVCETSGLKTPDAKDLERNQIVTLAS